MDCRTASLTAILGRVHIYTNIVPNPFHHKGLLDFTNYRGERYRAQFFFQSLGGGFTLGSDTTLADFMSDGTYTSWNDALNMAQSGLAKHSAKSWRTQFRI